MGRMAKVRFSRTFDFRENGLYRHGVHDNVPDALLQAGDFQFLLAHGAVEILDEPEPVEVFEPTGEPFIATDVETVVETEPVQFHSDEIYQADEPEPVKRKRGRK